MAFDKKTIRFYYWLVIEFLKKNLKAIVFSFFLSFLIILFFISFTPFFYRQFFSQKREIIGMVGEYNYDNLPNEILEKVSSGLLYIDFRGQLIPLLVNSWEVGDNGKKYRFHIKNGILWNDGKSFSAFDINYQFKNIKVKIIDERTIDFYLDQPSAIFPLLLVKPIFRHPLIGVAGLYRVGTIKTKYGKINEIQLIPNKKDIPILIYKFYESETKLITAYKLGEVNRIKIYKKNIAEKFKKWKNTTVEKLVDYSQLVVLLINHKNELLKEKEIKHALQMTIDSSFYSDFGEQALGPIPPTSWAYNDGFKRILYDQEAAQKIFKKNLRDGHRFTLYTSYDNYSIASLLKDFFEKVGLSVNIKIFSSQNLKDFDFFLAILQIPPDPDQYVFWHSTQKNAIFFGYKNVKVDKLLEDGRNTLDINQRKKIYQEYQKVMADDPPGLFLYHPYVYIIKKKLVL